MLIPMGTVLTACSNMKHGESEIVASAYLRDSVMPILRELNYYDWDEIDNTSTREACPYQKALKAHTTADEKVALVMSNDAAVIRMTAFEGLVAERDSRRVPLVVQMLGDTTKLYNRCACEGYTDYLADEMLKALYWSKGALSEADSLMIDSLFLYSPVPRKLFYRNWHIEKMSPTPENYRRAWEIWHEEHNQSALPIIIKARKDEDKTFVINLLKQYLQAERDTTVGRDRSNDIYGYIILEPLCGWTDPDFVPILTEICDYTLSHECYSTNIKKLLVAVMAYDNDWAYNIIEHYYGKGNAGRFFEYPETLYRAYYGNPFPHRRFLPLVEKYGEETGWLGD